MNTPLRAWRVIFHKYKSFPCSFFDHSLALIVEKMLFSALLAGFFGLACASPAPHKLSDANLARRQSGPDYQVYTFDQLVCLSVLIYAHILIAIRRSTISPTVNVMRPTPMPHSSRDMYTTQLITSPEALYTSTSAEKLASSLVMRISSLGVSLVRRFNANRC